MAYEYEDVNERSRNRELARIQRERMQKQQRLLRYTAGILVGLVCVLILVVLLFRSCDQAPQAQESTLSSADTTQSTQSTAPTQPLDPETTIRLVFGGDVNITDKLVGAGFTGTGYDYTQLLMQLSPVLSQADAAFLNLEGGFMGPDYGTATFSAPPELAQALRNAGVDMIQLANSRTIVGGLTGLSASIDTIRRFGMWPVGAFASEADRQESQGFTLVDIGGIRVAIVAFTKGLDGETLPAGSESCVNLLYTDYATTYREVDKDGITAVLQAAQAQQPDVTIAMVHWGSEYNDTISPTQEEIIKIMQEQGVDAIIGTHSHFVQKVEYDAEKGTLVAFSLGDLLGDAEKNGTNYSILLGLSITRDNRTGETRITGWDHTPVYVLTPEKDGMPLQAVLLEPAMELYENGHIHRVTDAAYENMKKALQRLESRLGLN